MAPLDGYSVADTALALLIGSVITKRFTSVYAAAHYAGIAPTPLPEVITDKLRTYTRNTWKALSALTDVPIAELRALNNQPVERDDAMAPLIG